MLEETNSGPDVESGPSVSPLPRGQWISADPKWFIAKTRTLGIVYFILGVLSVIPFVIWGWTWLLVFPGLLVLSAAIEIPLCFFEVKHHALMLRDDEILRRSGSISREVRAVPFGRVQHVELLEGPIDSSLGLATVTVRTAASDGGVILNGLPKDLAERLRDEVLLAAESRRVSL